jgi:3-oxoacyl-(acyl-carrier-protein) synthase
MDQGPESAASDSLVVTGLGHVVSLPCDPIPYLKVRKNRKMMGPQDDLAVVAAGKAFQSAGLGAALGERTGLYVAVGYIPFEEAEIELLLQGSLAEGAFSMDRFSTEGYNAVNPLLTFRCLSNMPAFHVSVNFDIQGPYFVTYPGPGQFYVALEEARAALAASRVDVAVVLGVAHQRNFLVRHHFGRVEPPTAELSDAAGCLVLERAEHARARSAPPRARLAECAVSYAPGDPFEVGRAPEESGADPSLGPASLPVALARGSEGVLRHELRSRDGIAASSVWRRTP